MSGKHKTILCVAALVAVLIVAQLIFGGKQAETQPHAPDVAHTDIGEPAGTVATPEVPGKDAVTAIELSRPDGSGAIGFVRYDSGWLAESSPSLLVDSDKIDRLLADLLQSPSEPITGAVPTGLAEGEGVRIAIRSVTGRHEWTVGLRPEGVYDKTFLRTPGGAGVLLHADLRGDMGIWENRADAAPAPDHWLDRRVLRFDPWDAVALTAEYPDHNVAFIRDEAGDWQASSYVPGIEWSRDGLAAWLEDLSEFKVGGVAEDASMPATGPAQEITVTLAGGGEKTLRVWMHDDAGALAVSSDYPDQVFHLPSWRYKKYFNRLHTLFPKAVPAFDVAAIRFIDIRRGGERVKIARRGDRWHAVAVPFALFTGQVDRLARFLSAWQPEDYANPLMSGIRPAYGGPMVDVTLADGEVFEYRLAGRHPLYPWRYVVVNGQDTFSIADREAGVLFPGLPIFWIWGGFFPDSRRTHWYPLKLPVLMRAICRCAVMPPAAGLPKRTGHTGTLSGMRRKSQSWSRFIGGSRDFTNSIRGGRQNRNYSV